MEITLILRIRNGLNSYGKYQLGRKLNTETFTEVSNLDDARNFSRIKGFPIMMVVTNENSTFSQKLLDETLNDPISKAEFNNIIYLHVTAEKNKDIIRDRSIRIFPSILFLGQDGELIHETQGNMIPGELARILETTSASCRHCRIRAFKNNPLPYFQANDNIIKKSEYSQLKSCLY